MQGLPENQRIMHTPAAAVKGEVSRNFMAISGKTKTLLVVFIMGTVLVLLLAASKVWWDAQYYDGYNATAPLYAEERSSEERPDYRRIEVVFSSVADQRVPTILALPKSGDGPFPCIIFLHGIGQKKEFLDDIAKPFVDAGFAFVSYDQYTRGERRLPDSNGVEELLALRRRAALNVVETRRLIDYLQTRKDIAGDRIYLSGASFGAITGSTAAAFDERIRAVGLVYGGGNLRVLLDSDEARRTLGGWTGLVKMLGAWIMSPADPVRYVAQISPRPVLFQGGLHDSIVPPASTQALYDAAKEPKEILWYDSDHIGLDEATVWKVLNDQIDWIKKQDARVLAGELEKAA